MPDDRNTAGENPTTPLASSTALCSSNPNNTERAESHGKPNPDQQESDKWFHNPDWYMVGLTVLLFVVGIYTAWIFHGQFKEMQTQTGILNTQAAQAAADSIEAGKRVERQLDLAGKQVKAAQDSAKGIQKQIQQDQRAWIDVGFGQFQWGLNEPVSIPVILTNVGKTPAMKFRAVIIVEVLKITESPNLSDKFSVPAVTDSAGIMTPHTIITLKGQTLKIDPTDKAKATSWNLGETDKLKLETGKAYWVAHGMIRYYDIFKNPHWRKFCSFGSPSTTTILMPTGACSEYNSADNN